jgi:hypothetical protein
MGGALLVIVALRVAAPVVLKDAVNRRLGKVPGYTGRVEDIDLGILRGAYRLRQIAIFKREGTTDVPFFSAEDIDFSLAWGELFHGRLVSEIYLDKARLQLTKATTPPATAKEEGRRWQEVVKDLFPIDITHLELSRSEVHFIDDTSRPRVDLAIRDLHAVATGLRNRPTPKSGPYPARLSIEGTTLGNGQLNLWINAEPLAAQPHFQLKFDLRGVDLRALNDFLEAYASVDVSSGTFQAYAEMTAEGGRFEGYVKPFAEHIEFKNLEDRTKGPLRRLWESFVSGLTAIVKNKERDQVGTRIPFSGEFGRTEVGLWATIVNLVRHGFVRPLSEKRDDAPPAPSP